ncbi:MAG TPA: hypothetical protein VM243_03545 [Phycisphaerae bacterium]|nr:hypothetical protein [Phycisphaerae bacterium]
MMALLATIFTIPVFMTGHQHAVLLLPLCLSIAIVYKTTRCPNVREIPLASLVLWVTIVAGMYAVGVGLWALSLLFA